MALHSAPANQTLFHFGTLQQLRAFSSIHCGQTRPSASEASPSRFLSSGMHFHLISAHRSTVADSSDLSWKLIFSDKPTTLHDSSENNCLRVKLCNCNCKSITPLRLGVVVSVVRRMDEVNPRRAQLVLGWVTSSGGYTISVCNHTTRLTQPCIPPGSLNRVPARLAVKAGMSPLPGGRQHCEFPQWCDNRANCYTLATYKLLLVLKSGYLRIFCWVIYSMLEGA